MIQERIIQNGMWRSPVNLARFGAESMLKGERTFESCHPD